MFRLNIKKSQSLCDAKLIGKPEIQQLINASGDCQKRASLSWVAVSALNSEPMVLLLYYCERLIARHFRISINHFQFQLFIAFRLTQLADVSARKKRTIDFCRYYTGARQANRKPWLWLWWFRVAREEKLPKINRDNISWINGSYIQVDLCGTYLDLGMTLKSHPSTGHPVALNDHFSIIFFACFSSRREKTIHGR